MMGLSLAALTFWLAVTVNWPPWHTRAWVASALSGLLNLLALYFLYRALARGPVAVASPAASTFTVLLVGLNILGGEAWSWLQIVAMLLVFVGVALLSRPSAADADNRLYTAAWLRTTAAFGLATAVTVALRMYLAQDASAELGALHAVYLNRLFALAGSCALLLYLLYKSQQLSWPSGSLRGLMVLQAILETAALGAFLIGSADDGRVAATIGFSAFAAATAVFARLWLKETIGWQRSWWILVVASGIVLAVVGSPEFSSTAKH